MNGIYTFNHRTYIPEAKVLIEQVSSRELFKEPENTIKVDNYEIVPWGENNTLPSEIQEKTEKSEVISSNLQFNILTGYGQGIKPMKKIIENNKVVGFEEVNDERVLEFFENNDIDTYFLEQLTDMKHFYNVFPEIILNAGKTEIVSLRSKEAVFSRWGVMDKTLGRITKHYYSAKWGDNPKKEDIILTDVLDKYNPLLSLQTMLNEGKYKELRFIVPVSFPTPGRTYYPRAYWWSIFQSGWYDFATMIPEFKKALMKNQMAVRYIIYISDKYFENIFKDENIDRNDKEAIQARKTAEFTKFKDFLSGEKNAGKGIVALKKMAQSASGSKEEKYIEIEQLKADIKGGEYIEDSEEVSNIISYAMGVHPSLIGSTPGKNKGSFSGTDKRELFLMKQALMKPFRDRLLKPLNLIKNFNKWDKDIVFQVPDYEFTTLDKNKSGKQLTVNDK